MEPNNIRVTQAVEDAYSNRFIDQTPPRLKEIGNILTLKRFLRVGGGAVGDEDDF